MNKETLEKLGAAFPFDEVEAKLQVTLADKMIGMVVFYLDSRIIQKRLDDVLGHYNWKNQYTSWHDIEVKDPKGGTKIQKSQLCGIAIYHEGRNEWVGKFDGAECSDIEPLKGGLTDSFKRAACMWGIGRYLYEMEGVWVEIKPQGKGHAIKDDQLPKLRAAYDAAVNKIFGVSAGRQKQISGGNVQGSSGTQQRPVTNQQNQQPPATPPVQQNPQANVPAEHDYKIRSIKPAGGGSHLIELLNGAGKVTEAYIQAKEQGIKVGTILCNVELEQRGARFGNYNLVTNYELAA